MNITKYITPSELAKRWQVWATSIDGMASCAGLRKIKLEDGRVGYLLEEVETYEAKQGGGTNG